MNRVGLILEGGGMRGVYTAGVLDCFLDYNIDFHNVIGVSAGACNATSYISKQKERNFRINTGYVKDKRYISLGGLLTKGSIFGMDFIFKQIPDQLDPFDYETYKNSKTHLTIVSTNCETGQAEYHDGKDMTKINQYLQASSSIPMMAQMVEIEGKYLLDGGTADSIPLQRSIDEGYTKHIIVLTRNQGYIKKKEPFERVYKLRYRKYPKLVECITTRHIRYNKSVELAEELEKKGQAVVIRPSKPLKIDRFETDPEKLKELYTNGYEDAKSLLPQIIKLCAESENVCFKSLES